MGFPIKYASSISFLWNVLFNAISVCCVSAAGTVHYFIATQATSWLWSSLSHLNLLFSACCEFSVSYTALHCFKLMDPSSPQAQLPTMPKIEFSPVQSWNSGKNRMKSLSLFFSQQEYKFSNVMSRVSVFEHEWNLSPSRVLDLLGAVILLDFH